MTSINPHYTFNYSQPEAYRFSHDSVFLARKVFELERGKIRPHWRVLDLCAGCGIVGLDFLFHCQKELGFTPENCDFLEVQSVYKPHFIENVKRFGHPLRNARFINQNFSTFIDGKYDLILCNPPYFDPNEGQLSPNDFKNRCRFFLDASKEALYLAIKTLLATTGRAYVLTRNTNISTSIKLESIGDIRGTPLLRCALEPDIETRKEPDNTTVVEI